MAMAMSSAARPGLASARTPRNPDDGCRDRDPAADNDRFRTAHDERRRPSNEGQRAASNS